MRLLALSLLGLLAFPFVSAAQDSSTVTTPTAAPFLVAVLRPAQVTTQPGETALFTVTVENTGNEVAKSPKFIAYLPEGLTFEENGSDTLERIFLDNLNPGEKFGASFLVVASKTAPAGEDQVRTVVSAENHGAVEVRSTITIQVPQVKGVQTERQPEVKGETLPETGSPTLTVLAIAFAFILLILGGLFIGVARTRANE